MSLLKSIIRVSVVLIAVVAMSGTMGCNKAKQQKAAEGKIPDMQQKLDEVVKSLDAAKEPYKGNLTPEKAAAITQEVSAQSMAAFPSGKDLPKDPKKLLSSNEKIRETGDKIYAKYGTNMEEMMRYISGLTPKEREIYNNKLTELFLEQSKKKYGTAEEQKDQPAPAATEQPKQDKK